MRRQLVSLLVLTAAPAHAERAPQPLADVAPKSAQMRDHVGPVAAAPRGGDEPFTAHVAQDGQTVRVRFSASYAGDPAVAQSYVDFLGGLPHGSELGRLRILIATPAEVRELCGGAEGTLACYDPSRSEMTVPGEQLPDADGVTTSYVMAHEYGHHIARWRSNAPFSALSFGPKLWASHELVCLNTLRGRLAPGDEGADYLANPGEAWADTYAHLTYPDVPWQYTPLLRPTARSKRWALRDVHDPWTAPAQRVFTGRFVVGGPGALTFRVPLRLDGTLRAALDGPAGANLDIRVRSLGRDAGATRAPGADDVFRVRYACRELDSEWVVFRVVRRSGHGPFTLTVRYAG